VIDETDEVNAGTGVVAGVVTGFGVEVVAGFGVGVVTAAQQRWVGDRSRDHCGC
jgi:hypothetical protein